jgi:hypothetical protein
MLNNDRNVRMLFRQKLRVKIVVQRPRPRRVQHDFRNSPERMRSQSIIITNIRVLLGLIIPRPRHILGMRNLDLVR